jgi:integrase
MDDGSWVDPDLAKMRLEDWAPIWLDGVKPNLKPSTVAGYESLIDSRIVPALGRTPLGQLRPSAVQTWLNKMTGEGLSASRVRKAQVVLKMMLDVAVRDGRVARNAALGVKLPKLERREAAYFEPEVVERIAKAMPEPYDLLVRVLGQTGLRFGEAAALQRQSVDLLRRRLRVTESLTEVSGRLVRGSTKTHAHRSVPLTRTMTAALTTHLEQYVGPEPDAPLFTGPGGGELRHSMVYGKLWKPTLKRLKLPKCGVHVLRHSAAAALIGAGASPKALQSVMGHRSAAFSLTVYGHLFESDLDELADALDEYRNARNLRTPRGLAAVDNANEHAG